MNRNLLHERRSGHVERCPKPASSVRRVCTVDKRFRHMLYQDRSGACLLQLLQSALLRVLRRTMRIELRDRMRPHGHVHNRLHWRNQVAGFGLVLG